VGHCEAATQSNSNGQTAGVREHLHSVTNSNNTHPPAGATSDNNNLDDDKLDNSDGKEWNDATRAANMEARYGPQL
jgi:hypothetical protein